MPRSSCVRFAVALALAGILLGAGVTFAAEDSGAQGAKLFLHKDWQLQSSCEVKTSGSSRRLDRGTFCR